MKKYLSIVLLSGSLYGAQSSTTTTITTNTTTTTTATPATFAFIYAQLVQNGVGSEDATQQSLEWHPPMMVPFTNTAQEEEQVEDAE